jgi:hypothetical protein
MPSGIGRKIKDQEEFVSWWTENIKRDGRTAKTSADLRQFLVADAEELTGIEHQQVSRWAKALKDT